jgi:hypothetical protein
MFEVATRAGRPYPAETNGLHSLEFGMRPVWAEIKNKKGGCPNPLANIELRMVSARCVKEKRESQLLKNSTIRPFSRNWLISGR